MASEKRDFDDFKAFPGSVIDNVYQFPTLSKADAKNRTRIWTSYVAVVDKDEVKKTKINWSAPKYKAIIDDYFIKKVHCAYIEFYILKNRRETNRIPKHYFVHAARIHHNIYLAQNEDGTTPEKRKIITKETVKTYFEQFTPSKIFYFITNKDE